jgi:RHS repeat-associated protein
VLTTRPTTTTTAPYKFTGKERDSESGLDNFGARYNSSAMGRFMSPDNPKFSEKTDPQTWKRGLLFAVVREAESLFIQVSLRYPADSIRLNSILFSIFYLLFSASLLSAFSSRDFRFSIFEFRSLTPFPSVTYSGLDTTVIL